MKKIFLATLITLLLTSCNNPMNKVYTQDGFMLDMVEIKEKNGEETVKKITSYVMQQTLNNAFNDDPKGSLVGKTYKELLKEAEDFQVEMKKKEEEEKRLAAEEEKRRKEISLKISQSLTLALTKKGFSEYNYQQYITYTFTFKNKTDRDILGVKGKVSFFDMFDEEITSLSLSYDDGIKGNETINYKAQTDYNQFNSDDTKLKNTELNKLKVIWEPEQLIFSDGEKIVLE